MSDTDPGMEALARERGHGIVARIFHWLTTLLVFATIPIGIAMTTEAFAEVGDPLFVAHKSIGVIILVVVSLRLLWRLVGPSAPPLPVTSVPPLERRIAEATHVFLYVLLLTMGVTGYLRVVSGDFPIELLDALGIPPLTSGRPELSQWLSVVHKYTSHLLIAVFAIHIAEVMRHTIVNRDGILSRMWPPWRRDARTR